MKSIVSTLAFIALSLNWASAQLVISEIMFNPPESGTDSLEYIEIYNSGMTSVDLNGYVIQFGATPTTRDSFAGSFMLPSGAYVVTSVNDSAVMRNFNLAFTPRQWRSGNGMGNNGAAVVLRDNMGAIVDSVRYANTMPWDTLAAGRGFSLVFCDPTLDNALPGSWRRSANGTGRVINNYALFGSPGMADSACSMPMPMRPNFGLVGSNATISEANGVYSVTVTIANPDPNNASSIDLVIGAGSTADASDFAGIVPALPVTLTFAAGDSTPQVVTLNTFDDSMTETTENLIVQLANPTNNAMFANTMYTVSITDNDPIGVQNTQSEEIGARLFPNPTQSVLNIHTNGALVDQVVITNALGQEVSRTQNLQTATAQLSVAQLPAGIYQVMLYTDKGQTVQRFVKQ